MLSSLLNYSLDNLERMALFICLELSPSKILFDTYAVETILVESVQHGVITDTGSILFGTGGGQIVVLFRPYLADTIRIWPVLQVKMALSPEQRTNVVAVKDSKGNFRRAVRDSIH